MPSKVVTRQHDRTALVASAAIANAGAVASGLNARLASNRQRDEAASPPEIDWETILREVAQFLADNGSILLTGDEDLHDHRRIEKQLRDRRDEAAKAVRNHLGGARFLLDRAFGKRRSAQHFPERGNFARLDAKNLVRVAKEVLKLLQSPSTTWPPLEQLGEAAPPGQLAAALQTSIPALEAAIDDLRPETSGTRFALGNRQLDLDSTVDALRRGTDFLYGLFRFAGFDFAADHLRPPRRRRRAKGEEGSTNTPPEGEEPLGEPEMLLERSRFADQNPILLLSPPRDQG